MTQTQLLNEFRQLSLQQQLEVIQAAMRILAEHFPVIEPRVNGIKGHKPLAEAAKLLLADYQEDSELTAFTALDGEPVYLDPTVGAEIKKTRPSVVVSDDEVGLLPLRVIVPLTDWKERYQVAAWMVRIEPVKSNGLAKVSGADAFQVRSVAQERFVKRIGKLRDEQMQMIAKALGTVLASK